MAYIGKKPSDITRAIATYDTFTGDGSTTTFTLSFGASSANDITVVFFNDTPTTEIYTNLNTLSLHDALLLSWPSSVPPGSRVLTTSLPIEMRCFSRDRKSTRLNSSHIQKSRMPSSA